MRSTDPFVRARLSSGALDVVAIMELVPKHACGALAVFVGVTRTPDVGREVYALEYEAWEERAEAIMARIAREVALTHNARAAVVVHRVGTVAAAEPAVVAVVAAPHRAEAFRAVEALVDRVKTGAPIWKAEVAPLDPLGFPSRWGGRVASDARITSI